jgi:hypothetical protein
VRPSGDIAGALSSGSRVKTVELPSSRHGFESLGVRSTGYRVEGGWKDEREAGPQAEAANAIG